jgi:hypothetical protein
VHAQVASFVPPRTVENVSVDNIKPHTSTDWQALHAQSLRCMQGARLSAVQYSAAVAKLIQAVADNGSGKSTASNSACSAFLALPLRVGGEACVLMDAHSRIAMKMRHRVLGKMVALMKPHREGETARDEFLIPEARVLEMKLYNECDKKSEYQNRAVSLLSGLRCIAPPTPSTLREAPTGPSGKDDQPEYRAGSQNASSLGALSAENIENYALDVDDILLSEREMLLNQFPHFLSTEVLALNNGANSSSRWRCTSTATPPELPPGHSASQGRKIFRAMGHVRAPESAASSAVPGTRRAAFSSSKCTYRLLAVDCEMCDTAAGHELTRVSVTDVNHDTVLDMLVKPQSGPILNYLTRWSGITEDLLRGVTNTLADAQEAVLGLMNEQTVLVGHSLENDLRALRIVHGLVIDTSVCFPHAIPGRKHALRFLAERMLNLRIQTAGADGHDSTEDASTAMR